MKRNSYKTNLEAKPYPIAFLTITNTTELMLTTILTTSLRIARSLADVSDMGHAETTQIFRGPTERRVKCR
jgi:hypothetical protein